MLVEWDKKIFVHKIIHVTKYWCKIFIWNCFFAYILDIIISEHLVLCNIHRLIISNFIGTIDEKEKLSVIHELGGAGTCKFNYLQIWFCIFNLKTNSFSLVAILNIFRRSINQTFIKTKRIYEAVSHIIRTNEFLGKLSMLSQTLGYI